MHSVAYPTRRCSQVSRVGDRCHQIVHSLTNVIIYWAAVSLRREQATWHYASPRIVTAASNLTSKAPSSPMTLLLGPPTRGTCEQIRAAIATRIDNHNTHRFAVAKIRDMRRAAMHMRRRHVVRLDSYRMQLRRANDRQSCELAARCGGFAARGARHAALRFASSSQEYLLVHSIAHPNRRWSRRGSKRETRSRQDVRVDDDSW